MIHRNRNRHGAQASAVPAVSPRRLKNIARRSKPVANPADAGSLIRPKDTGDHYYGRGGWWWQADRGNPLDRGTVTCRRRFPGLDPLEVPIPDQSIVVQNSAAGERPWEIMDRINSDRLAGFTSARTASVTANDLLLAYRHPTSVARNGRDFCAEVLELSRASFDDALWRMHHNGTNAGWGVILINWLPIEGGPLAGFLRPEFEVSDLWDVKWKYTSQEDAVPGLYARRRVHTDDVVIPWDRAVWWAPKSSKPYGWTAAAVLENCYPYWELARLGMQDWASVVAMIAQLLLVGKLSETNDHDDELKKLEGQMARLRTEGDAALRAGETLETLDINSTSGGNTAAPFVQACERIMANIAAGQTDTQSLGQGTGQGLAGRQVGAQVASKMTSTDAAMLAKGFVEPVCYRILAKSFGLQVAAAATPWADIDAWDVFEWKAYQDGAMGLHAMGVPQDVRNVHKFMTRSAPPGPDAEVIEGKAATASTGSPELDQVAEEQDIRPGQEQEAATRAQRLVRSRQENSWKVVGGRC